MNDPPPHTIISTPHVFYDLGDLVRLADWWRHTGSGSLCLFLMKPLFCLPQDRAEDMWGCRSVGAKRES